MMKMEQVSANCFAVVNEKNRVCDANSGLINIGEGMVIDTQSDLSHAQKMIDMFGKIWSAKPGKVVNTHEDADHVYGNQLFEDAEIIGHRSLPERMKEVADPEEIQKLMKAANGFFMGPLLKLIHPGVAVAGQQLQEDYDFSGVKLVFPTTLFDNRLIVELDGVEVHIIHVGSCHQIGDTIVWLPEERVLFGGDVIFRLCAPMGWVGTYAKWCETLDMIIDDLNPSVIVPGHGPVCGIEGAKDMKAYLKYVYDEARYCFDNGLDVRKASRKVDLGPYVDWLCPGRIYMNIERAYREFRGEPADKPWDQAKTFDEIYRTASKRGLSTDF